MNGLRSMKRPDAKATMLVHSAAKVEFFKKYLERYIRIIGLSGQFEEINIFDVFCGTGVYDNGRKGSPLAAFEVIKVFRKDYPHAPVQINLFVNDSASEKVDVVKEHIEAENASYCSVHYTTEAAEVAFQSISEQLRQQTSRVRNLIFVDPYGYKEVERAALEDLLKEGRTEIILFLPISHMQRFTTKAIESEEAPYLPLKNFVASFFPTNHAIRTSTLSAAEYTQAIRDALKFDKYYSTFFTIERDPSNLYALFFRYSPYLWIRQNP